MLEPQAASAMIEEVHRELGVNFGIKIGRSREALERIYCRAHRIIRTSTFFETKRIHLTNLIERLHVHLREAIEYFYAPSKRQQERYGGPNASVVEVLEVMNQRHQTRRRPTAYVA